MELRSLPENMGRGGRRMTGEDGWLRDGERERFPATPAMKKEKVKPKECPTCGEPMSRATTFGSFDFHWYCPVSIGGCGYKEAPE